MQIVKPNPCIRAVEAVTEILAVPRLDRIGKDFEHRVACGQSKGLPTGANNERNVFSTAVLTKSCAKVIPLARLRQGTRHLGLGSLPNR